MSLRDYTRKRRLGETPEPAEGRRSARSKRPIFVVQLHHARARHYDFRLEADGVLKSWAVPKGPSMRTGERRLAVEVEDHPLAYATFEGDIPEGHYGAGHVDIFDHGTWNTDGDPSEQIASGKLDFELEGERLRGGFTLVRTRLKGKQPQWLLIKSADRYARDADADSLLETPARRRASVAAAGKTDGKAAGGNAGNVASTAGAGSRLTSPERVVYPDAGITKAEVAAYYEGVASWLLPELVDRPLSLLRCPEGVAGTCFFQKHHAQSLGKNVRAIELREVEGSDQYLYVRDIRGVLDLVQMNTIEFHPWGARIDDVERPDRIVFDLDPGDDVDWSGVKAAARDVRDQLAGIGLQSWVRLSGGKGVHVVVPIRRGPDWAEVKDFCGAFAQAMAAHAPQRYVATATRKARKGRIYIDWLRNARGATSVTSWSLRARAGAPVVMPLAWKELGRTRSAADYDLRKALRRARTLASDPWEGFRKANQRLPRGV